MPETTPKGITYPLESDLIKTVVDPSKLATDLETMALTTDSAIGLIKYWKGASPLNGASDLNSLEPGKYVISNVVTARELNLPRERPGIITVDPIGSGRIIHFASIEDDPQPQLLFVRSRTLQGVEQPWKQLAYEVPNEGASASEAGPMRRSLLQQNLTARKGGRIGTSGKGVIALRFDDGVVEFRTKVLPLLIERGLPFSRITTSQSAEGAVIDPAEFSLMQDYSIQSGGEVWNHGATHLNVSGDATIYTEIVGALEDLRAYLPRIPVDCFTPPGGSAMSYDGHMPSATVANWADTYAGRLIMGHHAIASGYFADTYYRPLDGRLRDGQIHYGNDARTVAATKALVDRALDWKVGIVMMWHAQNLDTAGNMSTTDLIATLDYLVEQRDAGNLVILTASGLGVADLTSDYRDNILPSSAGNPFSASILYPQFRQSIRGSTRELIATVTGAAGATVTSIIGESTKSHKIPASGTLALRHVATIPLDATALTVAIDANTSDAKLLAV